jgi:hypothetical protein
VKNIAASFLQLRNQGLISFRRRADNTTEGDADWLSNTPTRASFYDKNELGSLQLVAMWNLHTTQPNTLFPTCDEVVNLTGLLETKGMSISSGK